MLNVYFLEQSSKETTRFSRVQMQNGGVSAVVLLKCKNNQYGFMLLVFAHWDEIMSHFANNK